MRSHITFRQKLFAFKKKYVVSSSTSPQKIGITETYSDYRKVDGVMIPFKTITVNPGMGEIVTYIKEIKQNVAIDDEMFYAKGKSKFLKNQIY